MCTNICMLTSSRATMLQVLSTIPDVGTSICWRSSGYPLERRLKEVNGTREVGNTRSQGVCKSLAERNGAVRFLRNEPGCLRITSSRRMIGLWYRCQSVSSVVN
ncbi:hypothetical protein BDQ12DRAFT_139133 [Crucibulum laeve]|uniref:Uncharacterized protein n=1 Tax=Crucibulum laeve TaxID=68775 RepID=A0A5C3LYV8_9AGAR|nr:hypothetical protein BDQ12DRAFT_139133 [Crucibulum laeve]